MNTVTVKSEQLTNNFSISEFACHDGTPVPDEYKCNIRVLAENLQALRNELGEPLHILSGYRTKEWNKKVGGKPKSQHLIGNAGDLTCKSKTPNELHELIEKLISEGKMKQGGLGEYLGFVHYDVRGVKARWNWKNVND